MAVISVIIGGPLGRMIMIMMDISYS